MGQSGETTGLVEEVPLVLFLVETESSPSGKSLMHSDISDCSQSMRQKDRNWNVSMSSAFLCRDSGLLLEYSTRRSGSFPKKWEQVALFVKEG
jgi:hypothetical protein